MLAFIATNLHLKIGDVCFASGATAALIVAQSLGVRGLSTKSAVDDAINKGENSCSISCAVPKSYGLIEERTR
jgi:hypothetical protein